MPATRFHQFEIGGRRYAVDPETCFCFECDAISWDVLRHYPDEPVNRIIRLLGEAYEPAEVAEVIGELEWLRSTRAILPRTTKEDLEKQFRVERGIHRLTVQLPESTAEQTARRAWFGRGQAAGAAPDLDARELARRATHLLLNRSGEKKELRLQFLVRGELTQPDLIADLCADALLAARLAGKDLEAAVCIAAVDAARLPDALEGHELNMVVEITDPDATRAALEPLARAGAPSLAKWARLIQPDVQGVTGRVIVRPGHAAFGGVVEALRGAGFNTLEIDVDGAYIARPDLDPAEVNASLRECAMYYAQRLAKHDYFRVDPIAPLFWRIYQGTPVARADPAGTGELAVDAEGGIYPSWRFFGLPESRVGSVKEGAIEEQALAAFDDVGAATTAACLTCWARNLCGGGTAAVHQALTGSHRTPHEPWCEGQRDWIAGAVAAFNQLSSHGVNFTRVYQQLGRRGGRPSLFTMARAAFQMTVGLRPVEESDAPMLVRWENWNPATYFTCTESGLLLATSYDREMDALHPQGIEQEFVLTRRDGTPIGLLRVRPDVRNPGAATAWVFMKNEGMYDAADVRKGFRALLGQAGGMEAIQRVVVPAAAYEERLPGFLEAAGFEREGTLREALYLHGAYHDVHLYGMRLGES